ncbi:hypothetical protein FIBSPDRAFT_487232 [Athelia psychrophila]|uniref:SWIM-type domain-containing protein n=1 Tax=Athelia psychrophila TaxID=1759441 RepID=A0A166KY95_9AGAM|nr:hypothetical protein FIBSPDRAFT_487232 [Fibularhizoctonia sp. CBS 109695]
MATLELMVITEAIIKSIKPGPYLDDHAIQRLKSVFPDTLILGALDLIDRDSVITYTTPWGRTHYEVLGSTATYTVLPQLSATNPSSRAYCSCPSFTYAVLISETFVLCKHVLAIRLAEQLGKCPTRPASKDDLVALVLRQNAH